MFSKNDIHMMYGSWDKACDKTKFFAILGHFLPFYLTNNPKNKNFIKMKKVLGYIIILHKCTKNHDHMPYCPWNKACDGCNFYFSFWAIFSTFTPLTFQKSKFFENEKNILRYHHFTYFIIILRHFKIWSHDVQFLRCGVSQMDRQTGFLKTYKMFSKKWPIFKRGLYSHAY